MKRLVFSVFVLVPMLFLSIIGCEGDSENVTIDGDQDTVIDGDQDTEQEQEVVYQRHTGLTPPPAPSTELGYTTEARTPVGTNPTPEEITAFTKKITGFFKDTGYWDWVYRTSHGLDASYDENMFAHKLWWQDTGMVKKGDVVEFKHRFQGTSENITKRTTKVMDNAIAGYLLTGDRRMGEVAIDLMRGIVALSLGLEREVETPITKYLQARAVFNHNHEYEVDGRKVAVNFDGSREARFKWNVHVFEIPDNPTFGNIWVSNMRSKDDVAYMFASVPIATRAYYEAPDQDVRETAELYIEYMRGFSQSIEDNDWHMLTKYEDGQATESLDYTIEREDGSHPEADLGSFVHWRSVFGPDAECNAQLGAAMAGYGWPADRGDCDTGIIGWDFERGTFFKHYFNYNIYNYFHIAAMATAQLWGYNDIAKSLNDGLVYRFEEIMHNNSMPNRDHSEYQSDLAGWLLNAATHGYAFNAEEAKHVMKWYGDSAQWYTPWPHWDPWASMTEGQELSDYKAPRGEDIDDGNGNTIRKNYVRLVEMPYIFEYCNSQWKNPNGVAFIDCDIVADPSKWGE